MRCARIASFGAWAASAAASPPLLGFDAASGLYCVDGRAPPALALPAAPPPRLFPAPPAAPLPPPLPALRHSLSFAALSIGTSAAAALPRGIVPDCTGASPDIWAPPPAAATARRARSASPSPIATPQLGPSSGDPLNAMCAGLGPQLLVLDVPNIGMRAGHGKCCSVAGVAACAAFWRRRGHVVIGFLPARLLSPGDCAGGAGPSSLLPCDDVPALTAMVQDGLLVPTPPGDYDDAYAVAYARRHGGTLVSNDRYADAVATTPPGARRTALAAWLKGHTCTFAFAGAEFLPNPAFKFAQPEAHEAEAAAEG